MTEKPGPWIQTFTGARHDLLNPDPWDIRIADIAHALSLICRFTGHLRAHYSVAQHSVNVARVLRSMGYDSGIQAQGLMHDAHEAYTGDVASPIKEVLRHLALDAGPSAVEPWDDFESRHESAVRTRFGIAQTLHPAVKRADLIMLVTEHRDLMGPAPAPWMVGHTPETWKIVPWTAQDAARNFLDEVERLDIR